MSDESDNILTFSELRKTQKKESREDELTELDEKFLLRVSNYFNNKKEAEGESREYKNAKRVLDKIVSLREEKIVQKARLSVKTGKESSNLNLLPEERELFRKLKQEFKSHRNKVDEKVESATTYVEESEDQKEEIQQVEAEEVKEEPTEKAEEDKEDPTETSEEETFGEEKSEEVEDGYKLVKTTSEVPEFMGTDLEAYGPFDPGEKVKIPDDNAEILVNRGNAEMVEE